MKFTCAVEIALPISRVIELFDNPDNLKEWQDGFVSFDHLEGERGKPGAKSKLVYESGKRKIELLETVLVRNLPHEFSGTYEHKSMTNNMVNRFTELDQSLTRWEAEIEYTKLNGFVVRLMAFLVPGMFKKQTQKWLDQFKIFAEKQG